jgi:chromosome segregation ATPase
MKKTSSSSSKTLSSSKSSSPSSWKLKRVIIENFKSINNADVSIEGGFTSIFGPNGSGKSCFLEAIVFALGASLNNMRVESINQIKSTAFITSLKRKADSSDNSKVTVTLFFNKDNTTKEISNSIVGNQRLHCIDKKKYGRGIFLEMVSDIFGFPRGDSFSYYISQRAVQAITQASAQVNAG